MMSSSASLARTGDAVPQHHWLRYALRLTGGNAPFFFSSNDRDGSSSSSRHHGETRGGAAAAPSDPSAADAAHLWSDPTFFDYAARERLQAVDGPHYDMLCTKMRKNAIALSMWLYDDATQGERPPPSIPAAVVEWNRLRDEVLPTLPPAVRDAFPRAEPASRRRCDSSDESADAHRGPFVTGKRLFLFEFVIDKLSTLSRSPASPLYEEYNRREDILKEARARLRGISRAPFVIAQIAPPLARINSAGSTAFVSPGSTTPKSVGESAPAACLEHVLGSSQFHIPVPPGAATGATLLSPPGQIDIDWKAKQTSRVYLDSVDYVEAFQGAKRAREAWETQCPILLATNRLCDLKKRMYDVYGLTAAMTACEKAEKSRGRESAVDGKSLEKLAFMDPTYGLHPKIIQAMATALSSPGIGAAVASGASDVADTTISALSRRLLSQFVALSESTLRNVDADSSGSDALSYLLRSTNTALKASTQEGVNQEDSGAVLRTVIELRVAAAAARNDKDAPAAVADGTASELSPLERVKALVKQYPDDAAVRADPSGFVRACFAKALPLLVVLTDVEIKVTRVIAQLDGLVVDLFTARALYLCEAKHSPADVVYAHKQRRRLEQALKDTNQEIHFRVPLFKDFSPLGPMAKKLKQSLGGKSAAAAAAFLSLNRDSFDLFSAFPTQLWGYVTRKDLRPGELPMNSKLAHHFLNALSLSLVVDFGAFTGLPQEALEALDRRACSEGSSSTSCWNFVCRRLREEWLLVSAPEGDYSLPMEPPLTILRELAEHEVPCNLIAL